VSAVVFLSQCASMCVWVYVCAFFLPDASQSWRCTYLAIVLGSHLHDAGIDNGIDRGRQMRRLLWVVLALEPLHNVEIAGAVQGDRVAVEEVGHQDKVAIGGELVGDELGIVEAVADDIGDAGDTGIRTGPQA
jgi:hypothetical protein